MRMISLFHLTVLVQTALAQNSPQILGAGYDVPELSFAPGQVVTLFIVGAKTLLPEQPPIRRATTVPLPTSLAGFSILITQGPFHPLQQLLPILSVQQTSACSDFTFQPACVTTAITVQIPVNLSGVFVPGYLSPVKQDDHQISITENGSLSASFHASLRTDHVHILTMCDSIALPQGCCRCPPMITHANGATIAVDSPAVPGETLSMYAVGLGSTRPDVPAGTTTPAPAPVTINEFMMKYSYAIDPAVSASSPISPVIPASISFTGLTPGQIGLYQVNFTVPTPPRRTRVVVSPTRT